MTVVTDQQAREALFSISEQERADRRKTGSITAVNGRNVTVLLDGEGTSVVTAHRGVFEPSIGAGVTVERIPGTTFWKVVGVRDTSLGASNTLPFDLERQGVELYYPLALEAINYASYNVGAGLTITVYNVQYVDYDKLWHFIAETEIDLLSYVPDEDSRWVVIYTDLATDSLLVYSHTTTDTPDGGWLAAVNGLLGSAGSVKPELAVQLDAGMTEWGDAWKVIKRGFSYAGKKIVRIPYYSPLETSETVADASEISYSPSNTGDWLDVPDNQADANNELASRLTDAEAGIIDLSDLFPIGSADVEPDLITGFAAITSVDPENDYILIFDASASALKKVALEHIGTGGSFDSPLATKGDILTHDGSTDVRAPIGANNETIIADSAEPFGWKWTTLPTTATKTRVTKQIIYQETLSSNGTFSISNSDLYSGDYADYSEIVIEMQLRGTLSAGNNDQVRMYLNGDFTETNYDSAGHYGGSGHTGLRTDTAQIGYMSDSTISSNYKTNYLVRIVKPASSIYKMMRAESELMDNSYYVMEFATWWNNTAAITQIDVRTDNNPTDLIQAGSTITIYGIIEEPIAGGAENIRIALFTWEGDVPVGQHVVRIYNDYGSTRRLIKVSGYAVSAPTGADILVDAFVNGTTVFTNQANRLSIVSGSNTGVTAAIDAPLWAAGEYLEVAVEQVGSSTPGSNLTVQVSFGEPL